MRLAILIASLVILSTSTVAQAGVRDEQKISDSAGGFAGVLDDNDYFGWSVGTLGDLDADGIPELAVGAPQDDDGGSARGAMWILFLNADGTVRAEQKISSTSGGLSGMLGDGDWFGSSFALLGDMDADGKQELAVGARKDDSGGTEIGAVWILSLNSDGTVYAATKIGSGAGGFTGVISSGDFFGSSLANIGDLDGDGISDLAVGAYRDDDGASNSGSVWILFLNADGTVRTHQKISATSGGFTGGLGASDYFGVSLSPMGDSDGDGTPDLAAGAWGDDDGATDMGAVWILFLNEDGTVKSHQKISSTEGGFGGVLNAGDRFGRSVASLDDLDGDGVRDLVVGAENTDDGGQDAGAVWVVFLRGDGTVKSEMKVSNAHGGFGGDIPIDARFGSSAVQLGDLDGDAVSEVVVGSVYDDDGGNRRGAAWVLFFHPFVQASATYRNSGANPSSYEATTLPILGTDYVGTVDLGGTTGHAFAWLVGFSSPLTATLGGGQVLLVNVADPTGELLLQMAHLGSIATFDIPVPMNIALAGYQVASQALHFWGVQPFALSNAQDLTLGY